ncbi:MAG: ABC transporter ATP-binding protein [Dehalococcoidales bacterium]|nr:ABC transporter ATP-binding protein [Dehalococcoidales bacterium]
MYEVNELTKIYDIGKVKIRALNSISFAVSEGDILAIMGRSGSGKSTLLRQMGLLDYPTSGSIVFDNHEMSRLPEGNRTKLRLKYMGYVFQEYALLGELTAHQNVYLPGMMLGTRDMDYKKRATELLQLVGLGERTRHYPGELSGGEQQRVAIARALINNPKVLLADEPCANLDTISSELVMETLVRLNRELKVTVVFVSHDPDDKKYAGTIITLSNSTITDRRQAGRE